MAGHSVSAIKKQRVMTPFLILLPLSLGCWDYRPEPQMPISLPYVHLVVVVKSGLLHLCTLVPPMWKPSATLIGGQDIPMGFRNTGVMWEAWASR